MTHEHNVRPVVYQIRVRGCLEPHWAEWLGGLTVTYGGADGRDTILCGPIVDQAALHGVLIKIRDLGVPLLSVVRVEPDPGSGSTEGTATPL